MVYHSVGCVVHTSNGENLLTRGQFYSSIWREPFTIVGVFNGEGPPVPIPNTEVKLTSADNTCLETDWEDRSMPTQRVWRTSSPLIFAFRFYFYVYLFFTLYIFLLSSVGRALGC